MCPLEKKRSNYNFITFILPFLFKGVLHQNDSVFAYFIETTSDRAHQAVKYCVFLRKNASVVREKMAWEKKTKNIRA